MTEQIRIVLADDHPLIRSGLRARLEAEPGIVVVDEAADGHAAQQCCRDHQVDVLVLDLHMPGPSPTETVRYVRENHPDVRVLVLTAYDDDAYVRALVGAGAAGYVLKDEVPDALVQAVRTVALGGASFSRNVVAVLTHSARQPESTGPTLSERERELLDLLARGWDNARLAQELHLGEQTVRNYLSRLYSKLGVRTRSEAIVWARDNPVVR
ncbi:MAG TPA: response regulator transcription factor [Thermomicrobiales bacterium]|jgi:DNA-binding NarL/FixJ family response regulator|nr:response regulator transcription factor [Thermomicrobiales bacterium]